jgi:simple sugar transport system permease protein
MTDLLLATLVRATPLLIIGLAVAIAFRAGIWNIGAEGQFYAGAIVATWIGTRLSLTSPFAVLPVVVVAALVAGAVWAAVPAWLRSRYGVLEVITTIMLNFIAEYLVGYLVQGPLQEAGHTYPQSDPIAGAARLAPLIAGTRLTIAFPLGVLLAAAMWVFLMRTRPGHSNRPMRSSELCVHPRCVQVVFRAQRMPLYLTTVTGQSSVCSCRGTYSR